jgi:hypothetical protein
MSHRRPLLVAAIASAGLLAATPAFADSPARAASNASLHDCTHDAKCGCHSRRPGKSTSVSAPQIENDVTQRSNSNGYTASQVPLFTDAG